MIGAEFVEKRVREAIDCNTYGMEDAKIKRAIAWALLAIVQRLDAISERGRDE